MNGITENPSNEPGRREWRILHDSALKIHRLESFEEILSTLSCFIECCDLKGHVTVKIPGGGGLLLNRDESSGLDPETLTVLQLLFEHVEIAVAKLNRIPLAPAYELDSLSGREKEILPFLRLGKTNPEIGILTGISSRTVDKHVASILSKFGYENRKMLIGNRGPDQGNG